MISFLLGVVFGACAGFVVTALVTANGDYRR